MLTFGIICALVATASAGYASSSSGSSSGLYGNGGTYGSTYSSNYPYTNNYVGYSSAGGIPYAPIPTPYDFQHLFQQQLAQQAYIQASVAANINAIRDQALYPNRYGGYYGGTGSYGGSGGYANGGSYSSSGAGAGTGTYGGIGNRGSFGGTYSTAGRPGYSSHVYSSGPNYASSGGAVGNGYQTGFAHVSPPGLDSRFGDEGIVTHSSGTPGFSGVSSFSSSSDVNGVRHRESGTSVNNNGKVTTYYNRGS